MQFLNRGPIPRRTLAALTDLALLAVAASTISPLVAQSGPAITIAIEHGSATFFTATNVPAIDITGKSGALQGRVQIRQDAKGLTLEHIEASMPVSTLVTGMAVRDEHMRKHIFTTSNGDMPEVRFESGKLDCPGVAPGHEAICTIAGTLAIRGVPKDFSIPLKIRQDASGLAFRASGDGTVKLSDYGIERPTQLGVKTTNEVKIHLDLSAKESATTAAVREGRP